MTPKSYAKCETLPLGAVKAEGFLKEQLQRSKDGMGGHLPEIEPGMIANPYVHKTYVKQWGDGDQSGWGAEISGNYYAGLVQLAFTLNDPDLIQMATNWVEAAMKNQREDGYLGTYYEPDARIYEDYNAWGNACGYRAMLFFYEATGREDVLNAVHRSLLWFAENWAGDKKTCYAGGLIIEPTLWVYRLTGDQKLLKFAEEYTEYLEKHTIFDNSWKHFLDPKLHYNGNHTAAYGTSVRLPALLYAANGEEKYLASSEVGVKKIMEKGVQLSGSPVSVTEYVGPVASTNETEYCSYAFFNSSYITLSAVTGKALYGDYMENMLFNGAEGARKKDERAIAYLSSPNQIFATRSSSTGASVCDMQVYSPCYPVSCCPVNSVAVVPEYLRGSAMKDADGNLYLQTYGPSSLSYDGWEIVEDTLYPFRNEITLHVKGSAGRTLYCRVPGWAKGFRVTQNGEEIAVSQNENGYIALSGDGEIQLAFHAEVEVIRVDDSDGPGKHPMAFRLGALLFSYKIEADWQPFYPATETPLPKDFPWYDVFPVKPTVDTYDAHEKIGLVRDKFPWSIAVDEKLTKDDVKVSYPTSEGYPWEDPYVTLEIPAWHCRLICPPYAGRTFEPFGDKAEVTEKAKITLVPYGATNLRISYFPRADV